jgi:hypothetical protein
VNIFFVFVTDLFFYCPDFFVYAADLSVRSIFFIFVTYFFSAVPRLCVVSLSSCMLTHLHWLAAETLIISFFFLWMHVVSLSSCMLTHLHWLAVETLIISFFFSGCMDRRHCRANTQIMHVHSTLMDMHGSDGE